MPIPRTRSELVDMVTTSHAKLTAELDDGGSRLGSVPCVDGWTVKQLLAVRAWWTHSVVDWVEAWRLGESPVTPRDGYRWKETPRLNDDLAHAARRESYRSVRRRLDAGYRRVLAIIDALDDRELLQPRAFGPAGKYPVARWISLNTARQYTTARTFVRRAIRRTTRR